MSLFCAQWPVRARTDYIQYRVGPRSLHVCSLFTRIFVEFSRRPELTTRHKARHNLQVQDKMKVEGSKSYRRTVHAS